MLTINNECTGGSVYIFLRCLKTKAKVWCVALAFLFIFMPVVKAETITYNVCKNGCEYSDLNTVIESINRISEHKDVTIDIYSELKVTKEMKGNYTNSVKVIGALSDDYYELSKDEIKATAEYSVAKKININVPITGKSTVIIIAITSIISFGALGYTVFVMKKKNKN